ncbi:MAG: metal-sulfur cluster assembly factor [Chloroflexi bacterium]|nr:metal-sulfur cluster assembly factor [Chloroflexota bacterium]
MLSGLPRGPSGKSDASRSMDRNNYNPGDKAMSEKEAGLYEALRTVIDPEIGMNVVELGLVRGVEFDDDSAHVNMIMTTPFCPYAPQLLEQTRRTTQDYLGVPTTIEMGMEMWDPSMMEEGAASDWGLF